jgi:hypothetical protein
VRRIKEIGVYTTGSMTAANLDDMLEIHEGNEMMDRCNELTSLRQKEYLYQAVN